MEIKLQLGCSSLLDINIYIYISKRIYIYIYICRLAFILQWYFDAVYIYTSMEGVIYNGLPVVYTAARGTRAPRCWWDARSEKER